MVQQWQLEGRRRFKEEEWKARACLPGKRGQASLCRPPPGAPPTSPPGKLLPRDGRTQEGISKSPGGGGTRDRQGKRAGFRTGLCEESFVLGGIRVEAQGQESPRCDGGKPDGGEGAGPAGATRRGSSRYRHLPPLHWEERETEGLG